MPRPKPNKLHDELDALLDGRPVELTDELAPLAEAAGALRAELASYELDPAVADRHLEQVLHGSATVVPLPVPTRPNGWDLRRRVAAVALAAALVLAPATMASAAALPGQPMYPFKRAIEELRIASVQWSPSREAVERTRVVGTRVGELDRLVELQMFNQLLPALDALKEAVVEAKAAVDDAREEGELPGSAEVRLDEVVAAGNQVLAKVDVVTKRASIRLPGGTRAAITAAVAETRGVLVPPNQDTSGPGGATPTPYPGASPPPPANPADPGTDPTAGPTPTTATTHEQPTTTGTPVTTTTTLPTTTTAPEQPTTTESTATTDSVGGGGDTGDEQTGGADDKVPADDPTADDTPDEDPEP